jgi:ankyrin repeat protein
MTDSSYPSLRFPLADFPMIEMVKLLLEVGSNPNDTDNDASTPLHSVASMLYNNAIEKNTGVNSTPAMISACKIVVQMLLDFGGHIDSRNKKGESPLEMLMKADAAKKISNPNETDVKVGPPLVFPLEHMSLQCLAAQVIVKNKLYYDSESLPRDLVSFVNVH